jgi:hypothetical protein
MADDIDPGFDPDEEERINELLHQLSELPADTRHGISKQIRGLIGGKEPQATKLVNLAEERYRFGQSEDGAPFAVPNEGPRVVRMLRGGREGLRAELAAAFWDAEHVAPGANALSSALVTIEGVAQRSEPERLHLRSARHAGRLILDLGRTDARAVEVGPHGWSITEPAVLFRRTKLTNAIPDPVRGGDLAALKDMLRIGDDAWPLVLAWLVLALDPDVAHPVLALLGLQGSGKSFAARVLASIIDPSTAPLRSAPRDVTSWSVAAAGSYVVPIDNVSTIPPWFSDALCRAATGDGFVNRRLYSDDDVSVLSFRRSVILTSIDPGTLRGDLADRIVMVKLERFNDERRTDDELLAEWEQLQPRVLGALLDLTADVLAVRPDIKLDKLPRMADYAMTLEAVDRILGTNSRNHLAELVNEISLDVLEGDAVAVELRSLIAEKGEYDDLVSNLLEELTRRRYPSDRAPGRDWPRTAKALGGRLRRIAPALATVDIEVTFPPKIRDGHTVVVTRKKKGGDGHNGHERSRRE